jgi:hypothetical protein
MINGTAYSDVCKCAGLEVLGLWDVPESLKG